MRRILSSIDIGTNSIKLVVAEIVKDKINVLCAVSEEARGIKKGLIENFEDTVYSIKKAIKKAEDLLGIKLKKIVASIPEYNIKFTSGEGLNTITNDDSIVTKSDISRLLKTCAYNKVDENYELINIIPIEYKLDGKQVKDPVGLMGNKLKLKSLIISAPKKNTYDFIKAIEKCGLEVIDIMLGSIADYALFNNEFISNSNGIIINLGAGKTTISAFYKGILISESIIDDGGVNVDNDISFMYKTKINDSKKLKERFALASTKYANPKETRTLINKLGEKVTVNQYELTEYVSARVEEILKKAKNEINYLTKKEISYIIITGGLTEIKDFNIVAEEIFGKNVTIGSVNIIGVRDNKYSTAIGMIKNFNNKLNMKDKEYSVFDSEEIEALCSSEKRINVASDSILGKVFGYFFDN
ncbi:MAG: cell division protein FtsA [Bacilli bacterium]|nr:cell division protein FtsA [Bacilli bacterium]